MSRTFPTVEKTYQTTVAVSRNFFLFCLRVQNRCGEAQWIGQCKNQENIQASETVEMAANEVLVFHLTSAPYTGDYLISMDEVARISSEIARRVEALSVRKEAQL